MDVSRRFWVIALVCAALCGLVLAVQAPSRDTRYGDSNIYVVNVSGKGRHNLTRKLEPAQRVARAISPDGRALAFDRERVENGYAYSSIAVLPTRGGAPHTLVSLREASAAGAAWSPDGKRIAFGTCCRDEFDHAVGVVRRDGHGLTLIPDASEPTWLGRTRLAFLTDVGDFAESVSVAQADGRGRRVIFTAEDVSLPYVFGPIASPNGKRVSFFAAYTYATRMYSIGVAPGSTPDHISNHGRDPPSWSPNSRRLAFVLGEGTKAALATVSPDGTALRKFAATRGLDPDRPSWSPDGRHIAFISHPEGAAKLMVLDVRRRSLRVVDRGIARQPVLWSPNGRRLYYTVPREI